MLFQAHQGAGKETDGGGGREASAGGDQRKNDA